MIDNEGHQRTVTDPHPFIGQQEKRRTVGSAGKGHSQSGAGLEGSQRRHRFGKLRPSQWLVSGLRRHLGR